MSEEEYFNAQYDFEKSFEEAYGVKFSRIRELAAAEREGRVVILDPNQEAIDSGILSPRSDAKTVLSTALTLSALAGKEE